MLTNQFRASLNVNGTPFGIWDAFTGGAVDSERVVYRPGNMGNQVALASYAEIGDVTVRRMYSRSRDNTRTRYSVFHALSENVGKGASVVLQPLDESGNDWGRPIQYSGILKSVTPPEHNSNNRTDVAMIEAVLTPEGDIG